MSNKVWRPSKRQADFLALPDSIFEGFYGGAAGGGKSDVLLILPIAREFYKVPQFKGIIFRRTFPELEESLILRSKTGIGLEGPSYYDIGGKYNDQKHVWTFPSGAVMRFSYLETDDDARSHDTAEYNYAAFDELTAFTLYQYLYITSRVRSVTSGLPAIIRSASNPGNVGHSWVLNRFVRPDKTGYKVIEDGLSKTKRIFIPAKVTDNPFLMKTDPGYVNRLDLLPEAERKAKKDGDWFVFAGQVFTEFRPKHNPSEPDNACHVIEPFSVPEWWPRILALDWGYTAQTYAMKGAVSPTGNLIIYQEFSRTKTSIDIWGAELAAQCPEDFALIVMDPSSNQNRGQGGTIKQQFIRASGFRFVMDANNDRISGKMEIHDLLRWTPRPKRSLPMDQFDKALSERILHHGGINAYHEYCAMFLEELEETNLPKLQIFKTCHILIDAIPLCIYDEKRREDIAEFDGDDPIDTLRYMAKAYERLTKGLDKKAQLVDERLEITEEFNRSGDTTRFYRRMELFESQNKSALRNLYARRKSRGFGTGFNPIKERGNLQGPPRG